MNATSDSSIYALGLLNAADSPADADSFGDEIHALAQELGSHRGLTSAMRNPALPKEAKVKLGRAVLDQTGASDRVARLVRLMIEQGDYRLLAAVSESYSKALAEKKGIANGEVRFALAADDAQIQEVGEALSRAVGREVKLRTEIDPSLIGGFVARVGDLVYDCSISRQLAQLRSTLLSQ